MTMKLITQTKLFEGSKRVMIRTSEVDNEKHNKIWVLVNFFEVISADYTRQLSDLSQAFFAENVIEGEEKGMELADEFFAQ